MERSRGRRGSGVSLSTLGHVQSPAGVRWFNPSKSFAVAVIQAHLDLNQVGKVVL